MPGVVSGTDKIYLLYFILFLDLFYQSVVFLPFSLYHHLGDKVHLVYEDVYVLGRAVLVVVLQQFCDVLEVFMEALLGGDCKEDDVGVLVV